MRPGTPGFVGERLVEAREARQLSAAALADLLGISRQAVYAYEKGATTPSPEIMKRVSELLRLPVPFFLEREVPAPDGPVFFRTRKATTKSVRAQARRLQQWTAEIAERLERDLELPEVSFPQAYDGDFRRLSDDDIEELALRARQHWRMGNGPISNVVRLLETSGAVVARVELGADDLDGLSARFRGRPVFILASDKGSAARSRFDAAHELGHLVLHGRVTLDDFEDASIFNEVERQAHRFAGAFLLPAQSFADECTAFTLDSFRVLKERWKVAIRMMIKRAAQLGFISDQQQRRLYMNAAGRGWSRREPLDDVLVPEQPQLLAKALRLLVEDRGLDAVVADQRVGVPDLERLACVSRADLLGEEAPIVKFQAAPEAFPGPGSRSQESASVIPLRRT